MLAELHRDYAAKRFDAVVQRARSIAALANDANALIIAANAAIQVQALVDADLWLDQLRSRHRDDASLRRVHANVLNRLGVQAGGGRAVNVVMNIATPDVKGFQRSQSQVAAQVSRALALGQRNR